MRFCLIRLGKDSVEEIKNIDSRTGIQEPDLAIVLRCKQVPTEVDSSTYCFIWLGSDNNKGTPTQWEQGLRAFGKVTSKKGGPGYNDEWIIQLKVGVILPKSIKQVDIIRTSGASFLQISDIPVIGINTHSNQTVQLIKGDEPSQNITALFRLLNNVNQNFAAQVLSKYSDLINVVNYDESPQVANEYNNPIAPDPDLINSLSSNESTEGFDEIEEKGSSVIIHPFDPTKIDIRPQPLTIVSILKRLESNPMRIDLNTEFQRKGDLWELENQSKLIESLLVRIPLPAFYFDGTSEKWLIVDGLQRISALRNFIILKKFKLKGLEYLKDFEGSGWDDLPSYLQTRIEETPITAYIINPGTPEQVKFNIFKRINTGGLILTPQEIRHALNQGVPAKFVENLAKLPEFIDALGGRVPTDRMEDRDYVTRFLGFYLGEQSYQPDLDTFLNSGMARLKSLTETQRKEISEHFIKAMKTAKAIWGEHAFRKKYANNQRRKPVNKALFECISVVIAKLTDSQIQKLKSKRDKVDEGLMYLLNNDSEFHRSISSGTGDIKSVERRYQGIRELFKKILND